MDANIDMIYDVKRKMLAKYPRFGSEIAVANIEFEDNRQEKRERFKARREKIEHDIRGTQEGVIELGSIGESKEAIDWKVLLRREVEKTETIWSQRRSIAENNYAYRLEENDIEDEAETEIMIDVSGSVDLDLVKAFLRQIKPILKQSKLKVGCFNEKFWGLVDIKSVRDIDNFLSEIDHKKYPNINQKYRFQEIIVKDERNDK